MRGIRRYALGLVFLLAGTALLSGCSGKNKEPETVNAAADGVITVGILNGNDSYACTDSQAAQGFSGIEPEIMEILAGNLEVKTEYKEVSDIQTLMNLLDTGKIDVAAGRLTRIEAYEDTHLSSRNYAKRGIYLIAPKHRYVDTLAGFEEGAAGLSWQIPAYVVLDIPYIGGLEQATYSDMDSMAKDIEEGVIAAGLCREREAVKILESGAKVQAAELRDGPKLEEVFYLASDQTELCSQVNDAINVYLDGLVTPAKEE